MKQEHIKESIFLYECGIKHLKAEIEKYQNRIKELQQLLKEEEEC